MTVAEKKYSLSEIKALREALGITEKHTPASTTQTAPALHGPFQGNAAQFGIFSTPGVRPERFSTLVRPHSLASLLGLNRSEYYQELLEIMTGVTQSSGTNATGFCGDPPTVGQGKVCEQIYSWGDYYTKTDLNALAKIGQLRHRADVPANILNVAPEMRNQLIPDLMYGLRDTRSQLQYELWRIGVDLERTIEHVLVQGDTTLTSVNTQLGWISEFLGLDGQIKTGYTDARPPNMACPAADSIVISFNAEIDGTIATPDDRDFVQALTDMVWSAKDRAREMGMDGVQWAFVGRKELFRVATEVLSCQYNTYRCNSTNLPNTTLNEDAMRTNDMRIAMQNGQYLTVDGTDIPFIPSEGVLREGVGANHFKSDLYLVPVSWQGMKLLNLEYFDMDNQYIQEFASLVDPGSITTMNNGMFLVGSRSTGLCKEYHFQARMRLILETPFLAGRLDDIRFTFRAQPRNADPADTYFYADGGRTYVP